MLNDIAKLPDPDPELVSMPRGGLGSFEKAVLYPFDLFESVLSWLYLKYQSFWNWPGQSEDRTFGRPSSSPPVTPASLP